MLNGGKENDSNMADEDIISMYSMVSEADDGKNDKNSMTMNILKDNAVEDGRVKVGLLILDGEEEDADDEEEEIEEEEEEEASIKQELSVPETVFLPSEVRSIEVVSAVTHHEYQEKSKTKEKHDGAEGNNLLRNIWNHLHCSVSRLMAALLHVSSDYFNWSRLEPYLSQCRVGICSFVRSCNTAQLLTAFSMLMVTLSFASWRSRVVWKNEALRLREELHMQKSLLPLTMSALVEREALMKRNKILEEVFERTKKESKYEDIFSHDHEKNEAVLSFKNCYVEASLSLGRCTKEWQKWWSDDSTPSEDSGSANNADAENEYPTYSYDDGFTDDMSKLMKSITNGLASTTTQSYSLVKKTFKDLSYDGIKDIFSKDDYIQSVVKTSTPEMASNDTGGRVHG